ncbi:dienelactone hydrolase family protein [Sphingomonas sp. CGMCC 1.13654]|uniref:Dienelactone hydrolase family protein n=1 Tax=Sphingomonas chungangi TaxID=2683589 RepID=A0A838L2G6_9SPHN|nr:dienelactone hydrolase family protein [Sphingomonas chungangi]MBA2932609.1 dienelactone hydrolase family protein [Sphingomonas chungangi]MVW56232.1 dienelactone hydrolase family protein [Sphingomonas chungangi]
MGKTIEVATIEGDARFHCYVAEPAGTARAAIVVIQEIFGVNAGIRDKCDHWAAKGYVALAPDLFWRLEPGFEIDPDEQGALEKGVGLMQRLDQDQAIRDIEATIHAARAMVGGGKVGAVGYCMGGRLAFMTAARTDSNATVGYYGVGIDNLLRESHAIAHPLMLHIASNDGFVPPETQKAMHEGLDDHPKVTLHDYAGLDHGFATTSGQRRDEDGARLADGRTEAFFAEHLG